MVGQPQTTIPAELATPPGIWRWRWLLIALAIVALAIIGPGQRAIYVGLRSFSLAENRLSHAHWPQVASSHFRVYYPSGQSAEAHLVLAALNQALPGEERNLAEYPTHPLSVILYASQQSMNRAVGEAPNANNIGYEYGGIIDILSPSAWLGDNQQAFKKFLHQGPASHELGHALLDLKANQNYPHWFNEGVAQYENYQDTGYQWLTTTNALTGPLYTMTQLGNRTFYQLPNQSRAYRQALALVTYLEQIHGHAIFVQFLNRLAEGQTFQEALDRVYHLPSEKALFSAWQHTMNNQTR